MSILSLEGISKRYGAKTVVENLNLSIERGEFITLLGASGCGKTTTLRMIAGLERPESGVLRFGDVTWAAPAERRFVEPQNREIGMVFQSYALWPHMTVFENVAYPLRIRGRSTDAVRGILELVHLETLAERGAPQLSGGQQQRVALARALACEPQLLLLDEPFSNLDVNLRQSLRLELRGIQRRLGLTMVLVTHDQADAFALSDRIVVMRDGRMEQCSDPETVYQRPATPFVRDFVGSTVVFDAEIQREASGLRIQVVGGGSFELPATAASTPITASALGCVSVRPEDLLVDDETQPDAVQLTRGIVTGCAYAGSHRELEVRTAGGQTVIVPVPNSVRAAADSAIRLSAARVALRAWPADSNAQSKETK
jgi:iron(III) transport system ATP-binding protein